MDLWDCHLLIFCFWLEVSAHHFNKRITEEDHVHGDLRLKAKYAILNNWPKLEFFSYFLQKQQCFFLMKWSRGNVPTWGYISDHVVWRS
jgi:hypothetical protein